MEFKAFPDIKRINGIPMAITQKIHGTNAQIVVLPASLGDENTFYIDHQDAQHLVKVQAGSRNRWIYPGDDNYGFAAFVQANREEIAQKLGMGVHFGEWAGPGINSGEGLTEKTFILFDYWRYPAERPLPPNMRVVPVLYSGALDSAQIELAMQNLKTNGSVLAPGFMRPEGIVVTIGGTRYKKVFDAEETQWTKGSGVKAPKVEGPDVSHLLQPIRMEKLLSRDENYLKFYPGSMKDIVLAYIDDLVKEGQITGTEGERNATIKALSPQLFKFVREMVERQQVMQGQA